MTKVPNRTLKDSQQRIQGQGLKILGAIRDLDHRLRQIPRDAIQKWKKYIEDIKRGALLDNIKAQKLKDIMGMIPNRVIKNTVKRIIGQGSIVAGLFNNLEHQVKKLPRDALNIWKKYIQNVKIGNLLSGIKAQQLKSTLSSIPIRVLKDSEQRIIGNGDKVLGRLKEL